MAALADTIELARRREQAQKWDQGEAAVAAEVVLRAQLPPAPEISEDDRKSLQPFVQWTTQKNARYCPAAPLTISAFVLEQAATGASTDKLLQQLDAIGRLHDRHNLANPCATWAARTALESVTNIEPPRSWKTPEKEQFLLLPAEIKAAVSRREQQREKELRRLQNELAAIKRSTVAADTKEPTKLKEETQMGKKVEGWQKGVGPYSKTDDIKLTQVPMTKDAQGRKDISKIVDANSEANGGFPAPLRPERKQLHGESYKSTARPRAEPRRANSLGAGLGRGSNRTRGTADKGRRWGKASH